MASKTIFLSYASKSFAPARDTLCLSALRAGFDEARGRGPESLESDFAYSNRDILKQARGGGYWLWKPKIILQELRGLNSDDILIYSDAGRSSYYQISELPSNLIERARNLGFLLGPTIGQHGPMAHWTKRDAFVLLEADYPEIYLRAPIQATWSIWTPALQSFEFLDAWLAAALDPRVLTDMENTQGLPNLPGFRDHRHDQSILSILAYKYSAPHLDYRGSFVEKLLRLRPQSGLANLFLKRIVDAERIESNETIRALYQSWCDIRRPNNT